MACVRIMRDDFASLDTLASISSSSDRAGFPVENAINRQRRSKVWRSGGYFNVTSSNNTIIFRETAAVELTATIAIAAYTSATDLGTAVKTALEAVGGSVYTVSQTADLRFKIDSDGAGGGGIFELDLDNGSFTAGDLLGFDTAAERTGSLSYTADFLRINTEEFIVFDLGIAADPENFILIGPRNRPLKFSPTATLRLEANPTNNFSSPAFSSTLSINNDNTISLLSETGLAGTDYRFWRLCIEDQNPGGFVEVGSIFLGNAYTPTTGTAQFPFEIAEVDRSFEVISEGGQVIGDQREKTQEFTINWNFLTKEEREEFEFIFQDRFGKTTPFFIFYDEDGVFNTDNRDAIKFVRFIEMPRYQLERANKFRGSWRLREGI